MRIVLILSFICFFSCFEKSKTESAKYNDLYKNIILKNDYDAMSEARKEKWLVIDKVYSDYSLLGKAISEDNYKATVFLLDSYADVEVVVNKKGDNAIEFAATLKREKILKRLISNVKNPVVSDNVYSLITDQSLKKKIYSQSQYDKAYSDEKRLVMKPQKQTDCMNLKFFEGSECTLNLPCKEQSAEFGMSQKCVDDACLKDVLYKSQETYFAFYDNTQKTIKSVVTILNGEVTEVDKSTSTKFEKYYLSNNEEVNFDAYAAIDYKIGCVFSSSYFSDKPLLISNKKRSKDKKNTFSKPTKKQEELFYSKYKKYPTKDFNDGFTLIGVTDLNSNGKLEYWYYEVAYYRSLGGFVEL